MSTEFQPAARHDDWVQLLTADRSLADAIPPAARDDAAVYAFAHTTWLEPGVWEPARDGGSDLAGHLGMLVLEGFLARHVRVVGRPPAELFGPGDLLHPWEPDHCEPFVAGARWDVLEPTRLAVLDRRFAAVVGRWPDVIAALFSRAIARSRSLVLHLAIGQLVGIEIRLLVLLWHIAERWGDHDGAGAADGCVVPVHLTHQLLAALISAQRPTVTSALASLTARGLISRRRDGLIVLHGERPSEFRQIRTAVP
jgi:CRP/FNR family transcriptional regulator, cyclic AMP receptor protein